MNGIALGVETNVSVRCVDSKGNIIQQADVHNKATASMVDTLLRFIAGEYTPSSVNPYQAVGATYDPAMDAAKYIPTHVGFGNVGLTYNDGNVTYNSDAVGVPDFYDEGLVQEIKNHRLGFSRMRRISYTDSSNSMGLLIQSYVPVGALVKKEYTTPDQSDYYDWTFIQSSGKHATYITELGLFAGEGVGASMLARATFNGELGQKGGPLLQEEDTLIIIEWTIGVVSVGDQDQFTVTYNSSLSNEEVV